MLIGGPSLVHGVETFMAPPDIAAASARVDDDPAASTGRADIRKPKVVPERHDRHRLSIARGAALVRREPWPAIPHGLELVILAIADAPLELSLEGGRWRRRAFNTRQEGIVRAPPSPAALGPAAR